MACIGNHSYVAILFYYAIFYIGSDVRLSGCRNNKKCTCENHKKLQRYADLNIPKYGCFFIHDMRFNVVYLRKIRIS